MFAGGSGRPAGGTRHAFDGRGDIVRPLRQHRPLAQQIVGSGGTRVERASRERRRRSAPCSLARRAVISEPERRLAFDHDHAQRESRNDPVARREMTRRRHRAEGSIGDDRALIGQAAVELPVLARVGHVDASGEHRDGSGRERSFMGRGVDPPRHAGDDDESRRAEIGGEVARELAPRGRAVAHPHHADRRSRQPGAVPQHGERRRRIGDRGKRLRIVRVSEEDHPSAEGFPAPRARPRPLARGRGLSGRPPAAARRHPGQSGERFPPRSRNAPSVAGRCGDRRPRFARASAAPAVRPVPSFPAAADTGLLAGQQPADVSRVAQPDQHPPPGWRTPSSADRANCQSQDPGQARTPRARTARSSGRSRRPPAR